MAVVRAECPSNSGSGSTLDVSLSAAPQGDVLVAMVGLNGAQNPSISGTGWTEIVNVLNGISARMKVWQKTAGASEPTTITFDHGSAVEAIGFVARLKFTAATAYINDSNGAGGNDDTVEAGSAGGSGADFLLSALHYAVAGVGISDYDGFSEWNAAGDSNSRAYVLYKYSSSSESPRFGTDTSGIWVAFNSGWDASPAAGMHHHLQTMGAR